MPYTLFSVGRGQAGGGGIVVLPYLGTVSIGQLLTFKVLIGRYALLTKISR